MSTTSKIEWTDKTWNPVWGCSLVSAGCANCYAMKQAHRFSGAGQPYAGLTELGPHGPRWTGKITLVPDALEEPLRWKKTCRVFVNSMSDLFHEDVPDEFIAAVFGVMAAAPQHTFQILTKRPERMRAWFSWLGGRGGLGPYIRSIRVGGDRTLPNFFNATARTEVVRGKTVRRLDDPWMAVFNVAACIGAGHLHNVWLGVSIEDQKTADERIPLLLETPAAVRFVSAEPLLGPVSFRWAMWDSWKDGQGQRRPVVDQHDGLRMLDWVIVGGESKDGARPMHPDWARSIRDQCQAAGVPFFFKQWGEWRPPVPGEAFNTIDGRSGKPPAFLIDHHGHVHCTREAAGAEAVPVIRVGKKAAGALLDGQEWREFPR